MRLHDHRRRVRHKKSHPEFRRFVIEMLSLPVAECVYCGTKLQQPEDRTVDHVVPIADGGTDRKSNLVISCRACNTVKSDMSAEEFMYRSGLEINWP